MKTSNPHLNVKVIAASLFGIATMVVISQSSGLFKTILNVDAEDDPYVLTMSSTVNKLVSLGGSGSTSVYTTSGNPVSLSYSDLGTSRPDDWCTLGMSGIVYNTSPITGITRVDISMNGPMLDYQVKFSWTGHNPGDYSMSEQASTTYSHSFTESKPKYFYISIWDVAGAADVISIVITYTCAAD